MIDHLTRSECFRAQHCVPRSLARDCDCCETVAFPLMTHPQPDTAERTRLAVQEIPFALPEKVDAALGPSSPEADELFNNILEGMARALPEKRDE